MASKAEWKRRAKEYLYEWNGALSELRTYAGVPTVHVELGRKNPVVHIDDARGLMAPVGLVADGKITQSRFCEVLGEWLTGRREWLPSDFGFEAWPVRGPSPSGAARITELEAKLRQKSSEIATLRRRNDDTRSLREVEAENASLKAEAEVEQVTANIGRMAEAGHALVTSMSDPDGKGFDAAWAAMCNHFGRTGEAPRMVGKLMVGKQHAPTPGNSWVLREDHEKVVRERDNLRKNRPDPIDQAQFESIHSEYFAAKGRIEELEAELATVKGDLDRAREWANSWKREFDNELSGKKKLRDQFGAKDDETFHDFVARLAADSDEFVDARATIAKMKSAVAGWKETVNEAVAISDKAKAELAEVKAGRRRAAQALIEEIGSPGPESIEETAARAVAVIRGGREKLSKAESERDKARQCLAHSMLETTERLNERDRMRPVVEAACAYRDARRNGSYLTSPWFCLADAVDAYRSIGQPAPVADSVAEPCATCDGNGGGTCPACNPVPEPISDDSREQWGLPPKASPVTDTDELNRLHAILEAARFVIQFHGEECSSATSRLSTQIARYDAHHPELAREATIESRRCDDCKHKMTPTNVTPCSTCDCDTLPNWAPAPKHITNEEGDCVSWCPACGPACKLGENSKECAKCKLGVDCEVGHPELAELSQSKSCNTCKHLESRGDKLPCRVCCTREGLPRWEPVEEGHSDDAPERVCIQPSDIDGEPDWSAGYWDTEVGDCDTAYIRLGVHEKTIRTALEQAAERVCGLVRIGQRPSTGNWMAYVHESGDHRVEGNAKASAHFIREAIRAAILDGKGK